MKKDPSLQAEGWLIQAYPEMHYMLEALKGDEAALEWLKENSKGISLLARAMTGKRKALGALHAEEPAELDDLFDVIDNDDLCTWLSDKRPDVHLLFGAIKGDESASTDLKRSRPALARLAVVVRDLYEIHLQKVREGDAGFGDGAAADMGCLIGEMHLKAGEYQKAVEAFTRAIESKPEADLFEGRAEAYRGLADADERRALQLRHQH